MFAEAVLTCAILLLGFGCGAVCFPSTSVVLLETPSSQSSPTSHRVYTKHANTTGSINNEDRTEDYLPAYVDVVRNANIRIHPTLNE